MPRKGVPTTKISKGRTNAVQDRFSTALATLVAQVKEDRSIVAAILCGSLSHDTVWEKSDIDLALITNDGTATDTCSLALYADGLNVHAFLMPRAEFRRTVEGSLHNSFMHSLLAKGKLLYTHDETIDEIFARMHAIGARDTQLQMLRAGMHALTHIDKAHKWLVTRGDLDYCALWILYAATPLARIEVLGARLLADREVIPQAMTLNPKFFKTIYSELLNARKTRPNVEAALQAADRYLAQRAPTLFGLIVEHLREVGEARSATEIDNHFKRNFNLEGLTVACEYLADQGLISKVSTPVQLTRRSNVQVQELAFVLPAQEQDEF